MLTQEEIDGAIILIYKSDKSKTHTNFVRPATWLTELPREGLQELHAVLIGLAREVDGVLHASTPTTLPTSTSKE